jgi:hypothetical protein
MFLRGASTFGLDLTQLGRTLSSVWAFLSLSILEVVSS